MKRMFTISLIMMGVAAIFAACESGSASYIGEVRITPGSGGFSVDAPTTASLTVSIDDGALSGALVLNNSGALTISASD